MDGDECYICLIKYDDGNNQLVILHCTHQMCSRCLGRIKAQVKSLCPFCRKDIKNFKTDLTSSASLDAELEDEVEDFPFSQFIDSSTVVSQPPSIGLPHQRRRRHVSRESELISRAELRIQKRARARERRIRNSRSRHGHESNQSSRESHRRRKRETKRRRPYMKNYRREHNFHQSSRARTNRISRI